MDCTSKFNDIDLNVESLVYEAASQIPKGRVSTYQDIARALGDPIAARAVGDILSHSPTPIMVPCHRIVYSSGEAGWHAGKGKGIERKIGLLAKEGVKVEKGKIVDFDRVRFAEFQITPVLKLLREEQERMKGMVKEYDDFGDLTFVAGLDVSYGDGMAYAALVVLDWETGQRVDERTNSCDTRFPYIPSYLYFRETPALAPLIKKKNIVYLIDGQGVLHPRGMGIASHIGVAFDIPTIGAAKSLLVGTVRKGSANRSPIFLDGKKRGCLIKGDKKAAYISVGNRVSLPTATKVCERFLFDGIPQPLRDAHLLANKLRVASKEKVG